MDIVQLKITNLHRFQACLSMAEIDPEYIPHVEHRPAKDSLEADGIPLIDLSPLFSPKPGPKAMEDLVFQIGEACKNWGFFHVINHGVSPVVRRDIDSFSRKFFAMPKEEKKNISSRNQLIQVGYHDSEYTRRIKDWKEGFDYFTLDPMIMPASSNPDEKKLVEILNQWPENLPGMRETCMEYGKEMEKLAHRLMELISLSLGLAGDRFHEFFKDHMSEILLYHYPPCPLPDLVLGVNAHKDCGALTVLAVDDVAGLQVKRAIDGQWLSVKHVPDAYIINVGDVLQVWSNDQYESVEHRVLVNPEKDRFSIPFFFNTSHYTMVQPLKELVNDQNPPRYTAYNWGKFFVTRYMSSFNNYAEETEIFHFKAA